MPIIEAMACGTPVVAVNSSSIPEAMGEAGLMAEAGDAAALLNHLRAVLCQPDLAYTLHQKGLAHARRFSWPESGRAMGRVYAQALKAVNSK